MRFFLSALVLSVAAGSASSGTAVPVAVDEVTSGRVAYWRMDSVSGTTTPGTPGDATLVNGAAAGAGRFNGGISLDGTNDYLEAADHASLNFGTGSFTVALWFRATGTASKRLINKWNGPKPQGWLLDVHSGAGGAAQAGYIRFRIDDNPDGDAASDSLDIARDADLDLRVNQWTHVAAVVNRSSAPGNVLLYVNGNPVGGATNLPSGFGSVSNTFALGIGTIPTSLGKYFAGGVDEVALYNRALTQTEVRTLIRPLPPEDLAASLGGSPGAPAVTLTWDAAPGADTYDVYRSLDGGTPVQIATGLTGTTYTDSSLPVQGNSYTVTYTVRGANFFQSLDSLPATVTVDPPPPRTGDHTEGLFDDRCACGSAGPVPGGPFPALALAAAGLAGLLLGRR
ncbi:MAG TPA: LamG domain-containing protein [Planctomycetota bacterium]|nr:LamG domain-containing protein [Planctomycetota bacterium]